MQKATQKASRDLHTVHFIKYWALLQQINLLLIEVSLEEMWMCSNSYLILLFG